MSEIVLPDPEPVVETDPAHTCDGWITVPRGQRPTCSRCVEREARYKHAAAGNGTLEEIREAISALETISKQGTPMGQTVKTYIRGLHVWACPRSVNVGAEDDPVPLIQVAGNRQARRHVDRLAKRAERKKR